MGTVNVQQTFIEKQCFSTATKLIMEVIEIKRNWPNYPDLPSNPGFSTLLKLLDNWTEALIEREGGL